MAAFPFSMYNQQGGRGDLPLTLAVIELIFADHFAAHWWIFEDSGSLAFPPSHFKALLSMVSGEYIFTEFLSIWRQQVVGACRGGSYS